MGLNKTIVRNLLVGKTFIPSKRQYKYALLRSQFAVIILLIAVIYIGVDTLNDLTLFVPWYILMALSALGIIYLNRTKHYNLATITLLVIINALIFLFADTDPVEGGTYFFFLTCSITGLILAGYYHRYAGIAFAVLPILIGFLSVKTDIIILTPPVYKPEVLEMNFIINFIIATSANIFIIYFLINRNTESEFSLRESEKHLLKIASDLEVSRERFALAVKGTNAGIYEWNIRKNTIYVSSAWKKLLGYDDHELTAMNVEQFSLIVHPEDSVKTRELINLHLKNLHPYQNELRMKTKSGAYRWFLDSGTVKPDSKESALMIVGSIIDIDDRKKAEEEIRSKNTQLAKTNEELDRFVYSASHDMRAPLSSLLGLINISEKTDNVDELHTYLQMMKGRIKTMEGFIKEVTDYSRNARLDLNLEKTDLESLIQEVTQNLSDMAAVRVRIEIDIPDKIIFLTDQGRLKVILNNLISNSYKYHRLDQSDPHIIFSAKRSQNRVVIRIADNGSGIEPDYHHKIFDMFFRASVKSEGSGLGLYIVKETLQKMGGTIWVESTPGEGSIFTFAIPA
jgi:PAS domain S-box-containing protein